MSREEAIDVLQHNYPSARFTDLCEAVDMAIKALSAQTEKRTDKRTETHPCDNQYCIQNGGDICDHVHCPIGQKQTFYDDITDEQEQLDFVQKHEKIPVVIKAETHGDTISRTAAIDSIMEEPSEVRYPVFYAEKIRQLPSAQQKGHWIKDEYGAEYCSECLKYPYDDGEYHIANWESDFCPNCGARMMKGEEDETD